MAFEGGTNRSAVNEGRLWRQRYYGIREELSVQQRQASVLVHEMHHRTINSLQLIVSIAGIRLRRTDDDETASFCRMIIAVVQAIARVHRHLMLRQSSIEMPEYVAALCHDLQQIMPETPRIWIEADVEPVSMPPEQATFLALITAELVINAVKHAFAGKDGGAIGVRLKRADVEHFMLAVADDGVGFPDGVPNEADALSVVRGLAGLVDGSIDISSGPCAEVRVVFPAS